MNFNIQCIPPPNSAPFKRVPWLRQLEGKHSNWFYYSSPLHRINSLNHWRREEANIVRGHRTLYKRENTQKERLCHCRRISLLQLWGQVLYATV